MLSPTVTAQQPITPSDGKNLVHFEFPPDLAAPNGMQQYPIASSRPPINHNLQYMEFNNENQAPMMAPAYSQPYPAIPAPQPNQLTIIPLHQAPIHGKTKIDCHHTHGTHSTKSVQSAEESTASFGMVIPFSQLTSTLNNLSMSTPDTGHPKRSRYKHMRKQARVVATAGGMVLGGLTLGPAGLVVGAGVGVATNGYYKRKDKRAQQKHDQYCFQQAANDSVVARHQGAFC